MFNCVARLGWLNRMTQFKEKAGKDRENASVGLYAYPDADGGRHPRLSRHARAGRATTRSSTSSSRATSPRNSTTTSALPSARRASRTASIFRCPSRSSSAPRRASCQLRDGTKKMSKSDPSDFSRINMTDDADTIGKKIQKAKTDPEPSAVGGSGARERGRKPTTSSASMRRWPGRPRPRRSRSSAARSSPPSRRRWRSSPSRASAPSTPR